MTDMAERSYEIMRAALDQIYSVREQWSQPGPDKTQVAIHSVMTLYDKHNGELQGDIYAQVYEGGGWNIAPLCPFLDTKRALEWLSGALNGAARVDLPRPQLGDHMPSPGQVVKLMLDALIKARMHVLPPETQGVDLTQLPDPGIALAAIDTALDAFNKVPALIR